MEQLQLYKFLVAVASGLILLGVITGLARFKRIGHVQKLMLLALLLALVTEVIARILIEIGGNNYPLFHVYAPLEYIVFAMLFSHVLNKRLSRVLLNSRIVFCAFAVVNLIFFQGFKSLNTNVTTSSSMILVVVSILTFVTMLSQMRYAHIERSGLFWISIGVLIYFSSSLLLFVYSNWLTEIDLTYTFNAWLIHLGFNIIHYLCFNIALWMDPE